MLYHYVFRGLGVLLAIGMLTILALATHSQFPAPETRLVHQSHLDPEMLCGPALHAASLCAERGRNLQGICLHIAEGRTRQRRIIIGLAAPRMRGRG